MVSTDKSFTVFREKLGRKIQKLRESKVYTQEDLAYPLDMDRVSVGYIEQGRRSPKLSTLHAISKILDISMSDIFKTLRDSLFIFRVLTE